MEGRRKGETGKYKNGLREDGIEGWKKAGRKEGVE